jgi:hypothetical protein
MFPEPGGFGISTLGVGLFEKRVTIFVGHFGSGKTEISLNGALDLSARNIPVTLADLDVVKPYFRTRSARAMLAEAGIELLAPAGENIFGDLPIIVPQIRSSLRTSGRKLIIDVGGDSTGARVLGSLVDVIPVAETDCLLVLNFNRPSTPTPEDAVRVIEEIEAVSQVRVTGLVSNTHLMDETDREIVLDGYRQACVTGQKLGIPVVAVAVQDDAKLSFDDVEPMCPIFVLRRIITPPFAMAAQRTSGPLFVLN